jgi:DNA-binding response OmpR family regulator
MNNISILIVEDEININEIIKTYLDREGYITHQSFDGKNAIESFNKYNPDIIILDIMLPDILGTEVCRLIREKSNAYIVMLTAKSDEMSVVNGLNTGADEYISKPFSARELVARINAISRRMNKDQVELDNIYVMRKF